MIMILLKSLGKRTSIGSYYDEKSLTKPRPFWPLNPVPIGPFWPPFSISDTYESHRKQRLPRKDRIIGYEENRKLPGPP